MPRDIGTLIVTLRALLRAVLCDTDLDRISWHWVVFEGCTKMCGGSALAPGFRVQRSTLAHIQVEHGSSAMLGVLG